MATKTGNSYTTGTTKDTADTQVRDFRPCRARIVSPSDCDNDRQPEVIMWPPKSEILITLELWQWMTIPTANLGFLTTLSSKKLIPGDCDDWQPKMAKMTWSLIVQFLVVSRCRNHLANILSSLSSSKIPNLALEFRRYLSEFQRCNYFQFWEPYRYFRLSIAVVLTFQYYFQPMVLKLRLVVGILTVPHRVSEI